METDFADAMRRATLATREHDVLKATKIILQAVTGRAAAGDVDAPPARSTTSTLRLIESEPHAERRETDFRAKAAPPTRWKSPPRRSSVPWRSLPVRQMGTAMTLNGPGCEQGLASLFSGFSCSRG